MKITIDVDISNIGQSLEKARKALGLSQTKVAAEADISQTHLNRIEKEEAKSVPFTTLNKVARVVELEERFKQSVFYEVLRLF